MLQMIGNPHDLIEGSRCPAGEFSVTDVVPGRYRVIASIIGGGTNTAWTAESAMAGTRDVIDLPLEVSPDSRAEIAVTFTDKATALAGMLVDASGRPAPDYFVIAFPASQSLWSIGSRRITAARPGVDASRVRQQLVTEGVDVALLRRRQPLRPDKVRIRGDVEQRRVELACSDPPKGRCHWTLRLLADELVVLGLVGKVSTETARQALKKTTSSRGSSSLGASRPTRTPSMSGAWKT